MATSVLAYREQLIEEINKTPIEHLPYLVQIIRIFRESLTWYFYLSFNKFFSSACCWFFFTYFVNHN